MDAPPKKSDELLALEAKAQEALDAMFRQRTREYGAQGFFDDEEPIYGMRSPEVIESCMLTGFVVTGLYQDINRTNPPLYMSMTEKVGMNDYTAAGLSSEQLEQFGN